MSGLLMILPATERGVALTAWPVKRVALAVIVEGNLAMVPGTDSGLAGAYVEDPTLDPVRLRNYS
jgi:hypothetical protein